MTVYCLVEEQYRPRTAPCPIRHGGFVPQLSDVAVLTMVICGTFSSCAGIRISSPLSGRTLALSSPPSRIACSVCGKPPTSYTQVTGLCIDDEGQVSKTYWCVGFLLYERIGDISRRPGTRGV